MQQTVNKIHRMFLVLATARYLQVTSAHNPRMIRYVVVIHVDVTLCCGSAIAVVYLACFLLLCGDVESNPGPFWGRGYEEGRGYDHESMYQALPSSYSVRQGGEYGVRQGGEYGKRQGGEHSQDRSFYGYVQRQMVIPFFFKKYDTCISCTICV